MTPSTSAGRQRLELDLLAQQDRAFAMKASDANAVEGAIANYETAFRMQSTIPDVTDIGLEPEHIREFYGVHSADEHQRYYATRALRARRQESVS